MERLEDRLTPARIDPVLEWNAIALQANAIDHTMPGGTQKGPVLSARALAIQSAAVFDACNSITQQCTPYLVLAPNAKGASLDAAVAKASRDTLAALYPAQVAMFDALLNQTLARVPNGAAENRGIQVGRFVARRILAARGNDGAYDNPPYTPGTAPGQWQPDPLHPSQAALGPGAGGITPFVLRSGSSFRLPPPPALDSADYATAYQELLALGGDGVNSPTQRTPEQTIIGTFWGYDGSPGLGTPPRLYNQVVRTIAIQQGNAPPANARLFALVNVAMADAGIACWETKYTYNFWRPITAIRAGDSDGNPATLGDADWTPLGAPQNNGGGTNFTPPFPAYASGHSTFGAATFRMLRDFYGRDNIRFTIGSDEYNGITRDQNGEVRPIVFRTYTSFSQAAEENGQSRIYLGIHWSFDKEQGIRQGSAIADYVFLRAMQPFRGQPLPREVGAKAVVGPAASPGRVPVAVGGVASTDGAFLARALTATTNPSFPVVTSATPTTLVRQTNTPDTSSGKAGASGETTQGTASVLQVSAAHAASVLDEALSGFRTWRAGV